MSDDLRVRIEALAATWRASAAQLLAEKAADPKRDPIVAVTWLEWAAREVEAMLAALPPDPEPTTREPCGAWREFHPGAFVLDGCALPRFAVCKRAYSLRWCWYSAGEEPTEADDCRSAMLAAEDAADALLLAGRRALGRIK